MSNQISPETITRQMNWRYATKKFDPSRKIPAETWAAIEEALRLSPSSFGLQPWRFYVIETPELRESLRASAWNQSQVTEASHLVAFAFRKGLSAADVEHYMQFIADVRGVTRDSLKAFHDLIEGSRAAKEEAGEVDLWSARQVYIAFGTALTVAAMLGVDSCPMEGIDPVVFTKALGADKDGYEVVSISAFGYRADDDSYAQLPKIRFAADDVIKHV